MRCPICDFDPTMRLSEQSDYFKGLSFDVYPVSYTAPDGSTQCRCFDSDFEEEELDIEEQQDN